MQCFTSYDKITVNEYTANTQYAVVCKINISETKVFKLFEHFVKQLHRTNKVC